MARCGDPKYGRTVHSLITALALVHRIGLRLISLAVLRLPEVVKGRVPALNPETRWVEAADLDAGMIQADVLYMTRIQRERFLYEDDYLRLRDAYTLTPKKLDQASADLTVMHPLPPAVESLPAVDCAPRAAYFQQAPLGKFVRMAHLCHLLGVGLC